MVKSLAHLFSRPPRSSVSSSLSSQTDDEDDVGARERARHSTSSHSLTSLDCTTTFYKSDDSGLHLKTYSTVSLAQPSEGVNLGVINTRNQSTKKPNIPLTHLDNWIWHEQQQASQLEEESAHAQRQSVYLTPNCKQHQMKPSKVVVSAEKSLKSVSKAFRKVFHNSINQGQAALDSSSTQLTVYYSSLELHLKNRLFEGDSVDLNYELETVLAA